MLTELLSEEYDVYQASNGEEGLSIAKSHADTLALILLDVMMPVMDGYTFLSKIKEDERLDMIPVIVMTQSGGTEEQIQAKVDQDFKNYIAETGLTDEYLTNYIFNFCFIIIDNSV